MELILRGGETWVRTKKKQEEICREGLIIFRGLLLPFETDFIPPRELCIVQALSKPPGLADEAYCLVF